MFIFQKAVRVAPIQEHCMIFQYFGVRGGQTIRFTEFFYSKPKFNQKFIKLHDIHNFKIYCKLRKIEQAHRETVKFKKLQAQDCQVMIPAIIFRFLLAEDFGEFLGTGNCSQQSKESILL